jgi:FKBP-type peptidyl-prolyl cis-trans isomerase
MKKLSTSQWIAIAAALVAVGVFSPFLLSHFFVSQNNLAGVASESLDTNNNQDQIANNMQDNSQDNTLATAPTVSNLSGIIIEDVVVGAGAEAVVGSVISANYTGKLVNGKVFDSSIGRQPITFPLGQKMVIAGWDEGLVGMKVGGKRILTISPEKAYGSREIPGPDGTPLIPANSTLIFEVDLVEVK